MAYSLATDKDLDVSDEFVIEEGLEQAKRRILSSGSRAFGDLSVIGIDGRIYHLHMPGLSLLMSPLLMLDISIYPSETASFNPQPNLKEFPAKLQFTRLGLLLMGMLSFLLLARLIYHFFNSLWLLLLLLILFIFSSPIPDFMFQLYPEFTACFLSLLVLNTLLFPFKNRYFNDLFTVFGIGFLPWLHQRFIFLALGLYLVLLTNEIFYRKKYKKPLILSLLLFITSLPYFYYFYSITGNPMPNSMHHFYGTSFTRFSMFPLGLFGHLFDYSRGMIWIFPWTALALIGIYQGFKLERLRAAMLLMISLPYFLFSCFHIAWHGMVKEPGRYLVAIFPLLILFLGYTVKTFSKRPTYFHSFLYIGLLAMVLLNKEILFLTFRYAGSYVTHSHIIQMTQCFGILVAIFFLTILSDKFSEKNMGLIPKKESFNYISSLYSDIKNSFIIRKIVKAAIYLPIMLFLAYSIVFLKNWNNEKMSMAFMSSLYKIKSFGEVQLIQKKNSNVQFARHDRKFINLFENVFTFSLDAPKKTSRIRIENTPFYEKIPSGCYRIRLETNNLKDENSSILMYFMGERKRMRFRKNLDTAEASTTFFLYKDRYVSPVLILELEDPESENMSGILEISPIPSLVYGKSLMLRLVPRANPKPVRKKRKYQYNLVFLANSKKDGQKYNFLLYTLKTPDKINRKQETLLASIQEEFTKKSLPSRVNIGFELSPDFLIKKSGLALFAYDMEGNPMECISLWLITHKKYWTLFKNPSSSPNKILFDF